MITRRSYTYFFVLLRKRCACTLEFRDAIPVLGCRAFFFFHLSCYETTWSRYGRAITCNMVRNFACTVCRILPTHPPRARRKKKRKDFNCLTALNHVGIHYFVASTALVCVAVCRLRCNPSWETLVFLCSATLWLVETAFYWTVTVHEVTCWNSKFQLVLRTSFSTFGENACLFMLPSFHI